MQGQRALDSKYNQLEQVSSVNIQYMYIVRKYEIRLYELQKQVEKQIFLASASLRVQINFRFIDNICTMYIGFFPAKSQNPKELRHHYFRFYYYSSRIFSANLLFLHSFVTDIQSNLPMWSPLLSSHLYQKVTFFLCCQKISYELIFF